MIYAAILIGIMLLLYAQRLYFQRLGLKSLTYVCYFNQEEVSEGDVMRVVEIVGNHRRTPVPWLKSELAVSPHLQFKGASSSHTDRLQLVSGIFSLHAHHQLRREWDVTAARFGRQGISKALLVSTDLVGRLTLSAAIPVGVSITVLPKPYALGDVNWQYRQIMGDLAVHRRYIPDPFMPSGVLPYTGLEPLRDIQWYASARQQELMVRDYQDSTSQSIAVILNLEKRTVMDRFASTMLDYESAIRLTATCFDMTIADGLPVEFIVNGRFLRDRQILPAEQQVFDLTGRYNRKDPNIETLRDDSETAAVELSGNVSPAESRNSQEPEKNSYYRSRRLAGRDHVHQLLRVLAWLEPGSAAPIAPLLDELAYDLAATDVLFLSQYVDQAILQLCVTLHGRGIRVKLGLLARQSEDGLANTISNRGLAELIPLYSLAGKLPDPVST